MAAVSFEAVDIVFGDRPEAALPLLDQGLSREQILAETGQVLGVAGCTLAVERGQICVLMGLSGSGKSTLLRAVNRLNKVVRGSVLVEDNGRAVDIARCDGRTLRRLRSERIAMVFQQFALLPWRTVADNVAFGLELRGVPRKEREAVAREYVDKVGLARFADAYPHQLSGGMRQRVGLARALAVDADILLMDEPFASVDEQIRRKFQEDLLHLLSDEDKTVVFVTHSIEEAVYVSDQIVILTRGPSRVSKVVRPGLDHSEGSDSVRRSGAYLDWVERIWGELESYLEE
jgi:ABC-type proline/glycine betaine transport system ATPase subunit